MILIVAVVVIASDSEFKKSGWDEPDSMSKDSWNQKSPKQNQSRKDLYSHLLHVAFHFLII